MQAVMKTEANDSYAPHSLDAQQILDYRANGWMKLENVINAQTVQMLLNEAKTRMGEVARTVDRNDPGKQIENAYRWYARWDEVSATCPQIKALSHSPQLASIASQLAGEQVRFYSDHVFAKNPESEAGGDTPWHQDFPHHPLDRQGALNIWIALVDLTPEMGTMQFLSRSHRAGMLGRYFNRRDNVTLLDEHPWVLDEFEMSPPISLKAGDATVHDMNVIHAAPANSSTTPRWVYSTLWLPVSARYTGASNHRTDPLRLTLDMPMEHPKFPIIPTH
ncbi:phytanoyl-CoA dioxygenase family protein [Pseudomonas sp. HN11]|uniref:phytanoyl-CoA dioxygenase family protein n=1 Tax=Pseudomonas sp. HN11 TaxID=1344094 RepID=UPI001F37F082|nr:phytanoyl-CoA dioxygenase family protein [Pseudomonas sp. HN11]UII69049.1 phytanoyl-CoA dioxygenase family protein [Pseudomonas sp. HN11]